jgi:phosphoserine phosphatase
MNPPGGAEKNGVKDIVLLSLTKEWPLSVQQLYDRVLKERPGISYHAAHKACQQLLKGGVLKKEKNNYSIATEWLEKVSTIIDGIKRSYLYNKPFFLPGLKDLRQEGETQTFVFENLAEAETYRKRLQWEYLATSGGKAPYCAISKHLRSPLFASERALNIMNMATRAKSKAFILCSGSTVVDEWCADYYRNQFVRVQTGADCAYTCDTAVLGDIVIQLYLPEQLGAYIDCVYRSVGDIGQINIPEFYRNVYQKKADIKLVVTKNSGIAGQLRQQIVDYFDMKNLAIFDINDTLVEGFLVKDFAEYCHMRGRFNAQSLEAIHVLDAAYKKGELSFTKSSTQILENYAQGVKGQKYDAIAGLAHDFVAEGRVSFFHYSKSLFNMVNSYRWTLGFTKVPQEIVEALRLILPFDEILATRLETRSGIFTGRLEENLASEGAKEAALKGWLRGWKHGVEGSLGFGDSRHDIAFLDRVSLPVALNPKPHLRSYAKRKRWLVFDKEAGYEKIFGYVNAFLHNGTTV